jgi:hypothetical protein
VRRSRPARRIRELDRTALPQVSLPRYACSVAVMPDKLRPACAVAVIGEQALQNVAGGGFGICGASKGMSHPSRRRAARSIFSLSSALKGLGQRTEGSGCVTISIDARWNFDP